MINASIRAFHRTLATLLHPAIYNHYVRLPSADDPVPPRIASNYRFSSYFDDVVGAIDGTHFPARVPASQQVAFRDRKGRLSWNLLVSVGFDMHIQYVLPGWEGSAADSRLWSVARTKDLLLPKTSVLLGDAGFPTCDTLLVPFRGTRYHLREWKASNARSVSVCQGHYSALLCLRRALNVFFKYIFILT